MHKKYNYRSNPSQVFYNVTTLKRKFYVTGKHLEWFTFLAILLAYKIVYIYGSTV